MKIACIYNNFIQHGKTVLQTPLLGFFLEFKTQSIPFRTFISDVAAISESVTTLHHSSYPQGLRHIIPYFFFGGAGACHPTFVLTISFSHVSV